MHKFILAAIIILLQGVSAWACGDLLPNGKSRIELSVERGEGTVKGGGDYRPGQTITLTARPATGYRFLKWVTCYGSKTYTAATISYKVPACSTDIWAYFVRDVKYKVVAHIGSGKGKVTGAGAYKVGSTVKLVATPAAGYAFQGWDFGTCPETFNYEKRWRQSSIAFVMPEERVDAYACFVKSSSDFCELYLEGAASNQTWMPSEASDVYELRIESETRPKLAALGLPAGFKLVADARRDDIWYVKIADAKKLKVGGIKTVKLTASTGSGKKRTRTLRIVLPNRTTAVDLGLLELNTSVRDPYVITAGVRENWADFGIVAASGWILKVKGLPPGLSWDSKNKRLKGVASKAGTYTATFTVARGTKAYAATATFKVAKLPTSVTGTFNGYTTRGWYWEQFGESISYVSRAVRVTVSSSGKLSAKVGSYVFAGTGLTRENGLYRINLRNTKKTSKRTDYQTLSLVVNPNANWNEFQMTGDFRLSYCLSDGSCTLGWTNPDGFVVAQRNPFGKNATTGAYMNAEAGAVVRRLNKLGKLRTSVTGIASGIYDLGGPACSPGMPGVSVAYPLTFSVGTAGAVSVAGKIGKYAVSGTSVLKVAPGVVFGDVVPQADFMLTVSSKKIRIHIEFDTESAGCRHGWVTVGNHDIGEAYEWD